MLLFISALYPKNILRIACECKNGGEVNYWIQEYRDANKKQKDKNRDDLVVHVMQ